VDGIQGAKLCREQCAGGVEDPIVEANEIEAGERVASASHSLVSFGEDRAEDLGAGQRTRDQRSSSTQVPSQSSGLGLGDDELDDR